MTVPSLHRNRNMLREENNVVWLKNLLVGWYYVVQTTFPAISSLYSPNCGTFWLIFPLNVTFCGFHCFHFHCVIFFGHFLSTPPQKFLKPPALCLFEGGYNPNKLYITFEKLIWYLIMYFFCTLSKGRWTHLIKGAMITKSVNNRKRENIFLTFGHRTWS